MSETRAPIAASVLVVDDVAENRDLLVRRLARLGIADVEQATNGLEALAAIERKTFHLVLLDIMMPEMDGFGVLERLRSDGRINDLPVVVISALNEIDPVVRCVELGAEDFIFKPFNPTLLRARVLASPEKKALRDRTREELRRKQAELDEARTLQLSLVPPPFRGTIGGLNVAVDVLLEPAKEVGGDLVDHFRIGDDLLVLALGDVSDKGAGAALMMARTYSLIRGLAARPDAYDVFSAPERALRLVNAALAENNASDMFVTFLLATADLARRRLTYVRAGHVPPFWHRAGGTVERLGSLGGLPLGMMAEAAYKPEAIELAPGDRLLILTDGFTEAHDPADALFGEPRIEALLAAAEQNSDAAARETAPASPFLDRLAADVRLFEAGRPASDDMAAILFRVA